MKDSCTLFKTAKWRHCKGKSHSGRLQSPGAQDIKFQVIPLPQTSCVTFSKSVSLVNVPKRVSWGLSSVRPKTKLPVSLIFEDSHPWPHVEHTRSVTPSKPIGFVYCKAHLERVCQVVHNSPWAQTADECTDERAPPVLSCLMANLLSRTTDIQCTSESFLIFYA